MVMDSFISCLHHVRLLRQPLNLLLHVTHVLCASIIAPFDLSRFKIPISYDLKWEETQKLQFFEILPGIQAVLDGFLTVLSPSITIIKYIWITLCAKRKSRIFHLHLMTDITRRIEEAIHWRGDMMNQQRMWFLYQDLCVRILPLICIEEIYKRLRSQLHSTTSDQQQKKFLHVITHVCD